MSNMTSRLGEAAALICGALMLGLVPASAALAQMKTVDPDQAIDGDLSGQRRPDTPVARSADTAPAAMSEDPRPADGSPADPAAPAAGAGADAASSAPVAAAAADNGETYREDDLIGAAEGVFGKGAKGLAAMIESILKKQGRPNGYIVGREGGGAFVVGLRYGSGTLHHKIEGTRPVYWTGPSIGFDAGAEAGSAFVLVYNLYDTEDIFKRFAAGEGQAYLIGGFNVSYLRAGSVVLVPVRMGVGARLGVNAGYMKFSHKQNWVPF